MSKENKNRKIVIEYFIPYYWKEARENWFREQVHVNLPLIDNLVYTIFKHGKKAFSVTVNIEFLYSSPDGINYVLQIMKVPGCDNLVFRIDTDDGVEVAQLQISPYHCQTISESTQYIASYLNQELDD